jgi:transcription termination/antitermination protein NusA
MSTTPKDIAKVRRLFRYHVPEIASGAVRIRGIAREVGKETIVAVQATKDGVCAVGACVGKRGVSSKSIRRVLPGEGFTVVLWSESPEDLIRNLLQPAITERLDLDVRAKRATVTVSGDTVMLTRNDGLRLRLVSQIAGWEVRLAGQQV